MLTVSRIAASLLLLFSVFHLPFLAQERAPESRPAPIVTATVTAERARFTAASNIIAMRLEVYTADGQRLFDSGFKSGTLLDWKMLDEQGQGYPAGTYLCVVAVKSLSGRISQKLGTLSITSEKAASLEPAETAQLSAAQLQALNGVENSSALTILREGEAAATTSIANTGTEAEITRGKGALSFRVGDFFSGQDQEQMRLTEEGNLGIGTDKPRARLDVRGIIRAEGIEFNDGSRLNISPRGGLRVTSPGGQAQSVTAPTTTVNAIGTAGQLAKWTDNAGTLGNSSISEQSGNVGIGTTTPLSLFHLAGPAGVAAVTLDTPGPQKFRLQTIPNIANWGALTLNANYIYPGGWRLDDANTNGWFFKLDTRGGNSSGVANGLWLYKVPPGAGFHTDEYPEFGVSSGQAYFAGKVGVGTLTPSQKLEVAGSIRLSGAGSALIFPDGSSMTTAAAGGGSTPSGTSIVNAINDPATVGTIGDTRLSGNVARLNRANNFSGDQSVAGNLTATGWMAGPAGLFTTVNSNNLSVDTETLIVNPSTRRVGIGTNIPGEKLSVAGTVQSTTGGFKFPDGSVQTSAADKAYTISLPNSSLQLNPRNSAMSTVLQIELPAGSYILTATVQFENTANLFAQNNMRTVLCQLNDGLWSFRLAGASNPMDQLPVTMQTVITQFGTGPVELYCGVGDGGTDRSYVYARTRRFTAIKIGDLVTQP